MFSQTLFKDAPPEFAKAWRAFVEGMRNAARSAPSNDVPLTTITDQAAGATAHIEIKNGVADVEIGFIKKFTKGFVDAIREYAKKNRAKSIVVNTGPVTNTDLAIKLGLAAKSGEKFFGGTIKLILGGKAPFFEITIPIKDK